MLLPSIVVVEIIGIFESEDSLRPQHHKQGPRQIDTPDEALVVARFNAPPALSGCLRFSL